MSYKAVYFHCNGGEFFSGARCPIDGVGNEETEQIVRVVAELRKSGIDITRQALEAAGVSKGTLACVVVVEFPNKKMTWGYFRPLSIPSCEHCGKHLRKHLLTLSTRGGE